MAQTTNYGHQSENFQRSPNAVDDLRLCVVRSWNDYPGLGLHLSRTINNVGIVVSDVEQSSPASACGIMAGDRIIEINGINVENSPFMKILQILQDELKSDEVEFLVTSSVNCIGSNYNKANVTRHETPHSKVSKAFDKGSSDAMTIASLVGKSTGERWDTLIDDVKQNYEHLNPRPLTDDSLITTPNDLDKEFKETLNSMRKQFEADWSKGDPEIERLITSSKKRNYRSHPIILERSSPNGEWGISVSPDSDVGHIIAEISPGSPAERANIRRGHVIIQISDDVVLHLPYKKLVSRLQSITTNQIFLSVAPKDVIMKCAIEHIPILTQYDTTKFSQPSSFKSRPEAGDRFPVEERKPLYPQPAINRDSLDVARHRPQQDHVRQSVDRSMTDVLKPDYGTPFMQDKSPSRDSIGMPVQKILTPIEKQMEYKPADSPIGQKHMPQQPEYPLPLQSPNVPSQPLRISQQPPSQQPGYSQQPTILQQQRSISSQPPTFPQVPPSFPQQPSTLPQQPSQPAQKPASVQRLSTMEQQPSLSKPMKSLEQEKTIKEPMSSREQLPLKDTLEPVIRSQQGTISPLHESISRDHPKSTRIINIPKNKSTPVGFQLKTFEGGVNSIHAFGDIVKGMAADIAGVQEGDKLISVDGVPVKGLQHEEVLAMLKADVPVLTVEVTEDVMVKSALESSKTSIHEEALKKPTTSESDLLTYTVDVDPNVSSIGLRLTKDMIIQSVEKDGAAERAGLKKGDVVVNVNGENVSIDNHQHAFNTLRQSISSGRVILVVKRDGIATKATGKADKIEQMSKSRESIKPAADFGKSQLSKPESQPKEPLVFAPALDEPRQSMQASLRTCVLDGLSKNSPIGVSLKDNKSRPAEITKITPGSPASKAGLNVGDYVLKINGTDVENSKFSDIKSMITSSVPTGSLELVVLKGEYYEKNREQSSDKISSHHVLNVNIQKTLKDVETTDPIVYFRENFGLTFDANKNNATYVKDIKLNSIGEKCGFSKGDILLEINNIDVEQKLINEVLDILLREGKEKQVLIKINHTQNEKDQSIANPTNTRLFKSDNTINQSKNVGNDTVDASYKSSIQLNANETADKSSKSSKRKLKTSFLKKKLSMSGGKGYKKCIIPTNSIKNEIGFTLVGSSEVSGIFYCKDPIPDSCAQLSGIEDGDMITDINIKQLKNMNSEKVREWIDKVIKREEYLVFGLIRNATLVSDDKLKDVNDLSSNRKLLKRANLSSLERRFDIKIKL